MLHKQRTAHEWFSGTGEMVELCRNFNWAATALGPIEHWSQSLRTVADAVLASRNPMLLFWGPELIQIYNDAFRPSLGPSTGVAPRHPRALGMPAAEFWTDVWEVVGPQIQGVMTRGEAVWFENLYLPIERGEGVVDDAWWTYSYSPVRDDDGRINATLVVCQETTPFVKARMEADAARVAAESANRAKSDFLAVMSHELRTPLNAIDGYAELLELGIHGPLTDEQRDDLDRIRRSERHLLSLINDVLNYSRIEAGAVRYHIEDVVIEEVLSTCDALTAPQRRLKELQFEMPPCPPGTRARADSEKVQQIILNLLINAIKFTDRKGKLAVTCTQHQNVMSIAVSDTGRGISSEQLERVFDPFVQVETGLTRSSEGVGLGLAISRDLARGMGGDLTVESEVGVGSIFTLTLPSA
jgi:signal transduction histidine kinase